MLRVRRLSWMSMAQRTASTALGNSASTASPAVLKIRPPARAMKSSITDRYEASRRSVSSSSSATSLLWPAISAAKIAAIFRFMPPAASRHGFVACHGVRRVTRAALVRRLVRRTERRLQRLQLIEMARKLIAHRLVARVGDVFFGVLDLGNQRRRIEVRPRHGAVGKDGQAGGAHFREAA